MVRASTRTAAADAPRWAHVVQKGQATDALLKRLKTLRTHLAAADELDATTLHHIQTQVFNTDLMLHASREIRTVLACCLAEVLRLYAPNCPFEGDDLRTVFSLFLAVLTASKAGLGKPNGTHFADCIALLERLIESRCFAIPAESMYSGDITNDYFAKFFELVKPGNQKNVEILCATALSMLLMFGSSVPSKSLDTLMANFHPQVKRSNPSAAHLAALVAQGAVNELQAPAAQYFADALRKAVRSSSEEERDESLHAAHVIIVQINRACPALLLNVMPQLEEEVRAEDANLRLIAVRTLGHVFGERSSADADIAKRNSSTWKAWLGRSNDRVVGIRLAWLEALRGIVTHHASLIDDLAPILERRLVDLDEKVRVAAVKVFASLDFGVLRRIMPRELLRSVGERTKDMKMSVRIEALAAMGRIYELAYPELESGHTAAVQVFGWIPNAMIQPLLLSDERSPGAFPIVQKAFHEHIIPLSDPSEPLAEALSGRRLLTCLNLLDAETCNAFVRISNLSNARPPITAFVKACQAFNGGIAESSLAESTRKTMLHLIGKIALLFADPPKAAQDLHTFAKDNDARLYKLLERLSNGASDVRATSKAFQEVTKRLSQSKYASTMTSFALLASSPFTNASSIPFLLDALQGTGSSKDPIPVHARSQLQMNARKLLRVVSTTRPEMLQQHAERLLGCVATASSDSFVRACCLYCLAKLENSAIGSGKTLTDEEQVKVVSGRIQSTSAAEEAKYAAKLLCITGTHMPSGCYAAAFQAMEEASGQLARSLSSSGELKTPGLCVLTQVVKRLGDIVTPHIHGVTDICVKQILMKSYTCPQDQVNAHWIEDEQMDSALSSRLAALQFLATRCSSHSAVDDNAAVFAPVVRLLLTCLANGEPAPSLYTGEAAKTRIRQEAGCLLLKLARRPAFDRILGMTDFQSISTMMQDESFQVRQKVLHKLVQYASRRTANLPARYYVFAFLVALDPEDEMRHLVVDMCSKLQAFMAPSLRLRYFDIGLARLLHLLNHHPDFAGAHVDGGVPLDSLIEASKYLDFFLDCCATNENFACLHHVAYRCKGMRDVFEEETRGTMENDGAASSGLHALSDLAMCLIKRRADGMRCNVGNYAGKIALPRDLFVPYISAEEQSKVYRRSYLSDEALEYFQQPMRREARTNSKRKAPVVANIAMAGSNGKTTTPRKGTGKRARRSSRYSGEDEDDVDGEGTDGDGATSTVDGSDQASEPLNEAISDDESVASAGSEGSERQGRGARVRERLRKEKVARNAARHARREAKAAAHARP